MRLHCWLIVLCAVCFLPCARAASPPITLRIVAETKEYEIGKGVFSANTLKFSATFTNPSAMPVYVSKRVLHHVCPESVELNGEVEKLSRSELKYDDGPEEGDPLVLLLPKQSMTLSISGLRCHHVTGPSPYTGTRYDLRKPGHYKVRFAYRYDGPNFTHTGVVKEVVLSNDVEFDVVRAAIGR